MRKTHGLRSFVGVSSAKATASNWSQPAISASRRMQPNHHGRKPACASFASSLRAAARSRCQELQASELLGPVLRVARGVWVTRASVKGAQVGGAVVSATRGQASVTLVAAKCVTLAAASHAMPAAAPTVMPGAPRLTLEPVGAMRGRRRAMVAAHCVTLAAASATPARARLSATPARSTLTLVAARSTPV
jgi:hypothetical protein